MKALEYILNRLDSSSTLFPPVTWLKLDGDEERRRDFIRSIVSARPDKTACHWTSLDADTIPYKGEQCLILNLANEERPRLNGTTLRRIVELVGDSTPVIVIAQFDSNATERQYHHHPF